MIGNIEMRSQFPPDNKKSMDLSYLEVDRTKRKISEELMDADLNTPISLEFRNVHV